MRHSRPDLVRRGDRRLPTLELSALSADSQLPHPLRTGRPEPLPAGKHFGLRHQRFFLPHGLQPLPPVLSRIHGRSPVRRAPAILYWGLGLTEPRPQGIGIPCPYSLNIPRIATRSFTHVSLIS